MEVLGLVALALVILAGASVAFFTLVLGAGPVPTSPKARAAMLSLVPHDVEGVLIEAGAGWGGVSFALAEQFPKATVVAWERSPVPYLACRLRLLLSPRPNLTFTKGDVFEADYTRVRGVVCYLHTTAMAKLAERLERQLPGDAFVISNTFGFRGWTPDQTVVLEDLYRTRVYRYLKKGAPARPG
jgi:hypothetical protein